MTATAIKSVQILGRRWRDKANGNTYHSARVFIDGECVGAVPFQYGMVREARIKRRLWLSIAGVHGDRWRVEVD